MEKETLQGIQFDTLDTYFSTLAQLGYLDDRRVAQIVTAVLLIDTLDFFKDYVTDDYMRQVEHILRSLKCCNCAIDWDEYKSVNHPAYNQEISLDTVRVNGTNLIIPSHIGYVKNGRLFIRNPYAEVENDTDLVFTSDEEPEVNPVLPDPINPHNPGDNPFTPPDVNPIVNP